MILSDYGAGWGDQDQLRVAGTGLVRHTEEGLLEGRIVTKDFRLQCGESTPRLVRCGRHYVKKYFITNMSMFCIGLYSAPGGGCLSWRPPAHVTMNCQQQCGAASLD